MQMIILDEEFNLTEIQLVNFRGLNNMADKKIATNEV